MTISSLYHQRACGGRCKYQSDHLISYTQWYALINDTVLEIKMSAYWGTIADNVPIRHDPNDPETNSWAHFNSGLARWTLHICVRAIFVRAHIVMWKAGVSWSPRYPAVPCTYVIWMIVGKDVVIVLMLYLWKKRWNMSHLDTTFHLTVICFENQEYITRQISVRLGLTSGLEPGWTRSKFKLIVPLSTGKEIAGAPGV